jgi:hypothetical protein
MKKKIIKYVNLSNELNEQGKEINYIISELKKNGANYAISYLTLLEIGYDENDIDSIIIKSGVWEGFKRSLEDMFFDFVELEDDINGETY